MVEENVAEERQEGIALVVLAAQDEQQPQPQMMTNHIP